MKIRRIRRLTFLVSLWVMPMAISAQILQDSLLSPTALDGADFQDRHWTDGSSLLGFVPGVWVWDYGLPGQWSPAAFSGLGSSRIAVSLDGFPVVNPWIDIQDLSPILPPWARQLEIRTNTSLTGNPAAGTTLDLVTTSPPSGLARTRIGYASGKEDLSSLDVTFAQSLGSRFGFVVSACQQKFGEYSANRYSRDQFIHSKFMVRPIASIELQYAILQKNGERDALFPLPLPGDSTILESGRHKEVQVTHFGRARWTTNRVQSTIQGFFSSYHLEIRDRDFSPKISIPQDFIGVMWDERMAWKNLEFTAGLKYQEDRYLFPEKPKFVQHAADVFVGIEGAWFRQFTASGRLDVHQSPDRKDRTLIAGTISWKPRSNANFWIGYNEGLRDPRVLERSGLPIFLGIPLTVNDVLLHEASGRFVANPGLRPEIFSNAELGTSVRMARRITFWARAYHTQIDDPIIGSIDGMEARFINAPAYNLKGTEARLNIGPFFGFRALVLANWAQSSADDSLIAGPPKFWGSQSLSWSGTFFKGDLEVRLILDGRWWDSFQHIGRSSGVWTGPIEQKPGMLWNATAAVVVMRHSIISFSMDNAFGSETAFIASGNIPKRLYRLGLTWDLLD